MIANLFFSARRLKIQACGFGGEINLRTTIFGYECEARKFPRCPYAIRDSVEAATCCRAAKSHGPFREILAILPQGGPNRKSVHVNRMTERLLYFGRGSSNFERGPVSV